MAKFLVSKYFRSYQNNSKQGLGWQLWELLKLNDEIKTIHQIAGEILKEPVLNLKNKTPFVHPKSTILSTLARHTNLESQERVILADDSTLLDGQQNTAPTRRRYSDYVNGDKTKRCRKAVPCKKKRRRPKKSDACKRDPDDARARKAAFKCLNECPPQPAPKTRTSVVRTTTKASSCSPICVSAADAKKSGKCKKSLPCKDREELEKIRLMAAKDDCKKKDPCSTEREDPCKPKGDCKPPCVKKKEDPCKAVRGDPCTKKDDKKCK